MADVDEFPRQLLRLAAMQMCERCGFKGVRRAAWDTLTDVLSARIELIVMRMKAATEVRGTFLANDRDPNPSRCLSFHFFSQLSRRTKPTASDLTLSLIELGFTSQDLEMLVASMEYEEMMPFARYAPPHPLPALLTHACAGRSPLRCG